MKNVLIIILLVAAVALGALGVRQRNQLQLQTAQLARAESRLAGVENQIKEKSEAIEKARLAEEKATVLKETLTQTSSEAVEKSQQVEQLQKSLAAAKTNSFGNLLAGMFKDPKMKEMIVSQQKMAIDKMYTPGIQQLQLSEQQAATLKDLIGKKMLASSEMGMSMLEEDMDAAKRKELAAQVKTETDGYDEQIKQLLGDDRYDSFKTYEKTAADRLTLGQFKDQLAGTPSALSSAQEDQLIAAIQEERNGFKWTTDYNNQKPGETDFGEMFNEDRLNKFAQEREQFDQQLLARAKQILTPEQYSAYEKNLAAQRAMQVAGMKMAAQMFGSKSH